MPTRRGKKTALEKRQSELRKSGLLQRDTAFTDDIVKRLFPILEEDYTERLQAREGTVEVFGTIKISPRNLRKLYEDIVPYDLSDLQVDEIRQSVKRLGLGEITGGLTREKLQGQIEKLEGQIERNVGKARKKLQRRASKVLAREEGLEDVLARKKQAEISPAKDRIGKLFEADIPEEERQAREDMREMAVMYNQGIPYVVDPAEGLKGLGAEARAAKLAERRKERFESLNEAVESFEFSEKNRATKEKVQTTIADKRLELANLQQQMASLFPSTPVTGAPQTFSSAIGTLQPAAGGDVGRATRAGVAAFGKSKMGSFERPPPPLQNVSTSGSLSAYVDVAPVPQAAAAPRRKRIVKAAGQKPSKPLASVAEAGYVDVAPEPPKPKKKTIRIVKRK